MDPGGGAEALRHQPRDVLQRHPAGDVPRSCGQTGYLDAALWTSNKAVDEGNLQEAGRELFFHQCHACHTIGGANNDILARTRNMSYPAMAAYIRTIHEKRYFMPPFAGTEAEGGALAAFIVKELHGKEIAERPGGRGGRPCRDGTSSSSTAPPATR